MEATPKSSQKQIRVKKLWKKAEDRQRTPEIAIEEQGDIIEDRIGIHNLSWAESDADSETTAEATPSQPARRGVKRKAPQQSTNTTHTQRQAEMAKLMSSIAPTTHGDGLGAIVACTVNEFKGAHALKFAEQLLKAIREIYSSDEFQGYLASYK